MGQLATMLTKQKRYDEAEPLFHQALAMRRATLEPGHPHIAVNINNLANLYRENRDYVRAEPPVWEATAVTRESARAEHHCHSVQIGNMARSYLSHVTPIAAAET